MDIFGDPFAQIGSAMSGAGRQQGQVSMGGYPGGMNQKQHGRFMEFTAAQHAHETGLVDRWASAASAEGEANRTHQTDVVRETGRQERLGAAHAVRQANKLNPGTTVSNGSFSAGRQHSPVLHPGP